MLVLSALGKVRQGIRSSLGYMERPYLKKRRDKCLFKIFYLCAHALGRWGCVHVVALNVEVRSNYTGSAGPAWATWESSQKKTKYNT